MVTPWTPLKLPFWNHYPHAPTIIQWNISISLFIWLLYIKYIYLVMAYIVLLLLLTAHTLYFITHKNTFHFIMPCLYCPFYNWCSIYLYALFLHNAKFIIIMPFLCSEILFIYSRLYNRDNMYTTLYCSWLWHQSGYIEMMCLTHLCVKVDNPYFAWRQICRSNIKRQVNIL